MERWLGWPVLRRIMAAHYARWQFKHPKPHDFFDIVNEVTGRDLGWYFDQVYRSSNVFDYGVQELKSTPSGNLHHTTVVVRRYGEALFPVDVLVTLKNGEKITEHWNGRDRWRLYVYDRPSPALSAQVDPGHVLLLDINITNNSKTLEPKSADASAKWSMKWMVWLQDALLTYAFFV